MMRKRGKGALITALLSRPVLLTGCFPWKNVASPYASLPPVTASTTWSRNKS